MKLRFGLNQAEAFRRGINCPKSTVIIDVNPAELDQPTRNLIAEYLQGIDVCRLDEPVTTSKNGKACHPHVIANEPNLESLLEALRVERKPLYED